jgi:hypothetical protein
MKHPARLALFLLLLNAASARAGSIDWAYQWVGTPSSLNAAQGNGAVQLEGTSGLASDSSDILAASLRTTSSESPDRPAVFSNAGYQLTLRLTDLASQEVAELSFSGQVYGTLSALGARVRNQFGEDARQQVLLGKNWYEVDLAYYTPPGRPGTRDGLFGASVAVAPAIHVDALPGVVPLGEVVRAQPGPVTNNPEPSSLVLAGLGSLLLGGQAWRRRSA